MNFILFFLNIIGLIFIILSIILKYKFKHLIKNCTNSCEGTLIKLEEIKLSHRSEDSAREYYAKENVPIYSPRTLLL